MSWDDEDTTFRVVVNHEEQYSIWPDYLELPKGWSAVGPTGKKQVCLEYIKEHWTDMRPLSLRQHMQSTGQ
jgi:MbtH protein